MPSPDLFGILDVVKKLTAPAGFEAAHRDGFSWARNGLSYGDSTKLTSDDWNRIIGNFRVMLIGSGIDLATLDPADLGLLRDVVNAYVLANLGAVLPDYIDDNAAAIAADIIAGPVFSGILAGAMGALTFNFATATADADPGPGLFRLNNAAPPSATAVYLDNTDAYAVSVAALLDQWDDSTNTVKGTLTIRQAANAAVKHVYNVTGSVVDGTGYRKLTLAWVAGSGTIAAGASCWLAFSRAGDKGNFAGPAVAVDGNIMVFNGTTGALGKDSGVAASSVVVGPASAVSDNVATFNGTTGKLAKDSGVAVSSLAPKASPTFTGIASLAQVIVKFGTNSDSTSQPSGTWAQTIYNATNAIGQNGLLVKNNWGATTSTIFEVGQDAVGGAYVSQFKINGVGAATFRTSVDAASYTRSGTALPFQKAYESAQQTITAAGALTLAHGLGVAPKLYAAFLQCTTAELGYSIGNEVEINPGMNPADGQDNNHQGMSLAPDATNVNVRYGAGASVFSIIRKDTGINGDITNSSWRLVVRAWA